MLGCGFQHHAFQLNLNDENIGNHAFITDGYERFSCGIVEQSVFVLKISTPSLKAGVYWIMFKVNGVYLPQSRMCSTGCYVTVRELATVTNVYPVFSPPGTVITMEGRVYSQRFTGNLDAFPLGREQNIRRAYSGGYTCAPQANGTDN
ncbi:Fibrocystin-L [Cichlidogyrus casuarinus]|uniref:Fibrocystin-L n=1 Tax=Cichlidogyrus casuarinus TaxID=1844966 RepID=A0ABD2QCW4_9PLAT